MGGSSQLPNSMSQEFVGILRNRLENMSTKAVAAEIDVDASHVGKVLNGTAALKLTDVASLLKLAGLKVVDQQRTCVRPDEIAYLRQLYARVAMQAPWLLNEDEA